MPCSSEAAAGLLDDQHLLLGPVGASGGPLDALPDQGQQCGGGPGETGDRPAGRQAGQGGCRGGVDAAGVGRRPASVATRYPTAATAPQARCGSRVEVAAVIAAKAAEAA